MAGESKTKKIIPVGAGAARPAPAAGNKPPKQRAASIRIIAVCMWVLAIAAEAAAILILNKTIYTGDKLLTWLIIALVVDLIFVIIGSQFWKKANRIDPASQKNKLKFWLWNNMGVIVCAIAFLPIIILMLKDENLDPKAKKIAAAAGAVALLIAAASSYTWNPVSQESLAQANAQVEGIGSDTVYWTRFGKKYHLDENCSSLTRSDTLFSGTVNDAFEANRLELCTFCANAHNIVPVNQ